ncbi:MAG TPA: class E sortase [Gaiellaceae bacterium]|nr:class E sortase [Gaiellaceae bacterium]
MRRHLGTFLLVIGVGVLAWAATVYLWKDPLTTAYTAYEQRRLASNLDREFESWTPTREPVSRPANPKPKPQPHDDLSREARRFRLAAEEGDAIARLRVPKLGLNLVVVNGTDSSDLRRGPGRHEETFMPGEGRLVYVAGHRTTYGAPFSDIDRLNAGDTISIELPYGSVEYRVTGQRIVDDNDLSVLESRGREELVLQACHPRFFASRRLLVYARPVAMQARS